MHFWVHFMPHHITASKYEFWFENMLLLQLDEQWSECSEHVPSLHLTCIISSFAGFKVWQEVQPTNGSIMALPYSRLIVNLITWDRTRQDRPHPLRCCAERCKGHSHERRHSVKCVARITEQHPRAHTHTLTCTKRPHYHFQRVCSRNMKLGESRANQNQRQSCLKSRTPPKLKHPGQSRARSCSRWCFLLLF